MATISGAARPPAPSIRCNAPSASTLDPESMASVRSHGGTEPASPKKGSSSATPTDAPDRRQRPSVWRMPSSRPRSSPRWSPSRPPRRCVEAHRGPMQPVDQPAPAVPAGTHGRVEHRSGDRDRLGQGLGNRSAASNQHEHRGCQRVLHVGHEAARIGRTEPPRVPHDHHPTVDEKWGRGAQASTTEPTSSSSAEGPPCSSTTSAGSRLADEFVEQRADRLGHERRVVTRTR